MNLVIKKRINQQRKVLNLKPTRSIYNLLKDNTILSADNYLYDSAKHLKNVKQIPYLSLENETELPTDIMEFMNDSRKCIYVGFGSMPGDKSIIFNLLIELAIKCELKIIIQPGYSESGNIKKSDHVYIINKFINHDKLFPAMEFIIHHGGAGTTQLATKHGIFQFIIPHLLDQYYWANALVQKGMGQSLNLNKTSKEELVRTIQFLVKKKDIKNTEKVKRTINKNGFNELDTLVFH